METPPPFQCLLQIVGMFYTIFISINASVSALKECTDSSIIIKKKSVLIHVALSLVPPFE